MTDVKLLSRRRTQAYRQLRRRRLAIECLETRRVLASMTMDFSVAGASQFGLGRAVFEDEVFIGVDRFDTGNFKVDLFDDVLNAGVKANIGLSGKAGLNLGYYVNAGSIDVAYENVTLTTDFEDADELLDTIVVDPNVSFSSGLFNTQSPTLGAYVDLVLRAATRGSLTGQAPWPFEHIGGTVNLNRTLVDVNQELLSFNRNGSNQLRLLGEDFPVGGVEINVPVSAAPPTSISIAAAQLADEDGNSLLGVEAAATLTVANLANQISPKSVKKGPDNVDNVQKLKDRARQIANSPLSVELATMQLNVPQISLSDQLNLQGNPTASMSADNSSQRERENLLAALNLNLGLKDLTFTVGPGSISVTPFNFQISPSLYATQAITVTPINTVIYTFDHPVSGSIHRDSGGQVGSFASRRSVEIDASEQLRLAYSGRPIDVSADWRFRARIENEINIKAFFGGSLTVGDFKVDADLPKWINDAVGLPFDPRPLYQNNNFITEDLGSFTIDVPAFDVMDQRVQLETLRLGRQVQGSLRVDHTVDEITSNGLNSLREAVIYANSLPTNQEAVIYLDAGTYTLTRSQSSPSQSDVAWGDLDIFAQNLRIVGKGIRETVIDTSVLDRVFEVHPGAKLTLEDLTITGGESTGIGGGIRAAGELHLLRVAVTNNNAQHGGGLAMLSSGSIRGSEISWNSASGRGGGLFTNSTPSANISILDHSSTFHNNNSGLEGGAVYINEVTLSVAAIVFVSSTISTNRSNVGNGVAIFSNEANVTLNATTITENRRPQSTNATAVYMAGGSCTILGCIAGPRLTLRDSIVAGNYGIDVGPINSVGPGQGFTISDFGTKNLIGSTQATGWGSRTIRGTSNAPIDPKLGFLFNFELGRSTFIHIPRFDSPAIGGASGSYPDQRGNLPIAVNDVRDIGAVQFIQEIRLTPSSNHYLGAAVLVFSAQGGSGTIRLAPGTYNVREADLSQRSLEIFPLSSPLMPMTLTISGSGQANTILDAAGLPNEVFTVGSSATFNLNHLSIINAAPTTQLVPGVIFSSGTLNISNVTLAGNSAVSNGGVIFSRGDTNIYNSTFENNSAGGNGGAIHVSANTGKVLNVERTKFFNNTVGNGTGDAMGGAIDVWRGDVQITDSLFRGNRAGNLAEASSQSATRGLGGAIHISPEGSVSLSRSSLIDNTAIGQTSTSGRGGSAFGGGIYSSGELTMMNSTLAGNSAFGGKSGASTSFVGGVAGGGAIYVAAGAKTTTIAASTIARNRAEYGRGGANANQTFTALGGGIWADSSSVILIGNTVVADNSVGDEYSSFGSYSRKDVRGFFTSEGHNFIGVATDFAGFDAAIGDQFGLVTNIDPDIGDDLSQYTLDPMLSELGNFGGHTPVMMPLLGSPLIDNGDPTSSGTDQRGMPRVIGPQADIGSVELNTLFVSTTEDLLDQRSLRRAMIDANILSQNGSIVDIRLAPGVYVLDRQGHDDDNLLGSLDVKINKRIRIFGAGAGETVIDSRDVANKTFDVFAGAELTLEGLTIYGSTTNPHAHAARAIANFGTLFIRDTHITGARTGAAIRNAGTGTLIVERSSFTDNQNVTGTGGAILNDGHMTIRQSSFANNVASQGGAITQRGGSAVFQRVTIAGNEATIEAGGIASLGGTFSLTQSIVANNSGGSPNLVGQYQSQGNNLIGQTTIEEGFLSSDRLNINPLLNELTTDVPLPYFDLQLTSPALDQGVAIPNLMSDQIGRPSLLGNAPDIGAIESLVLRVFRVDDLPEIGTLRYAVTMANQHPGMDSITFDNLPEPILLAGSPLRIEQSVSMNGHHSGQTTVDADGQSRVFEIGTEADSVSIGLLTITGGSTAGNGGGIYAETANTQLQIVDSHLTENHSDGYGGGIYSPGGRVEMVGTSLTFNTATHGAGVYLEAPTEAPPGHFASYNSTFSNNSAGGTAGGLGLTNATGSLTHTTIAENQAEADGGGAVFGAETAVTIQNSIVAKNHTQGNAPDMWWSPENMHFFVEYSLIGDNRGTQLPESPDGSNDPYGNIVGSASGQGAIDPMLGALYDNGGATPTLTPQEGSAAVGAASGAQSTSRDQRGLVRDSSTADMGAVEVQEVQNFATAPTRSISKQAIEGSRLQVTYIYKDFARTEVFAAPEVMLNLLPWASPVEAQRMMEGTTLQQIPIEVGDFELEEAGELHSIQITASSSNPSIIPNDQIVISGSGENRFITIKAAENAVDSQEIVTITITLDDGIGTNAVSFPVTVVEAHDIYLEDLDAQDIRIARQGDEVQFFHLNSNEDAIFTMPLADINGLRVHGQANTVNSIEIDYATGGLFDFPFGFFVDGGDESSDQLTIAGTETMLAKYQTTIDPTGQPEFLIEEADASALIRYANFNHFRLRSFAEFIPETAISIAAGSFSFDVVAPVILPSLTVLNGATLNSTSTLVLPEFATLRGSGSVNANFTSDRNSELTLTGNLDFGSPSTKFDFASNGRIHLHESTLSIFNANAALIGGSISLDIAESNGRLQVSDNLHIVSDEVPDLKVNIAGESEPAPDSVYQLIHAEGTILGEFTLTDFPAPLLGTGWHLMQSPQNIELGLRELATVNQVVIGDEINPLQRSRVTQVEVRFDGAVDIQHDAFEVRKRGPQGGIVATAFVTRFDDSGNTIATLTFVGSFTRGSFNSLVDGNYQLTIDSTKVRLAGTQLVLDGNQDGKSGGNHLFGADAADRFFAFYGDTDGDRDVDGQDLQRFGGTFRRRNGQAGFFSSLDFEGDGDVDGQDLQQFAQRFRTRLSFV